MHRYKAQKSLLHFFNFKLLSYIFLTFVMILFIFTRLYRLDTSLLFYNDMGRDYLELLEWQQTKIPPLLGPQISVLSFNQSPFYFYILFPMYLLTNGSSFASTYTIILWYLFWFIIGVWVFRKDQLKLWQLVIIGILFTIHAEVIRQTRFVWNPSFLPPLMIASLFAHQRLTQVWTTKAAWVLALTGSLAMSLNFSAAPLYVVLFFSLVYFLGKKVIPLGLKFLTGFGLWYLPTLFFEIRHHFALTKLLFTGQTNPNSLSSFTNKLLNLEKYVLLIPQETMLWTLIILVGAMYAGIIFYSRKQQLQRRFQLGLYSLNLVMLLLLTFVSPISIEAHYIFGLLCLSFFVISLLPLPIASVIIVISSGVWLTSPQVSKQYTPAVRTVAQMQSCYQSFCSAISEPLYVSMESGILPFHNAPEHRYLMTQAGCNTRDIIKSQTEADYMAVIADSAKYDHGQTAYYELTLFGPAKEIDVHECTSNLQIHLLKSNPQN